MKKGLLFAWLTFLFIVIGFLFWRVDYAYSIPTKVPVKYTGVATGSQVLLPFKFDNGKPVFLHFFNPDCPCSRFNINHFKELYKKYGSQINFVMVVLSEDKGYDAKRIKKKYGIDIPVYNDSSIAAATGIYSTPQAVILTPQYRLFYRGNYNKSRYCTNKQTNYAQMALEALLHKNNNTVTDMFALKAYGCTLPKCEK